ncbi:hypothetical protein GNIT_0749 [Glaciecola nitratireducens FR1064]|uniref:Uncharacterized protein n=1 Tax=Glaciecola nitratireducens (strain JCM 12485 / KCTC 12276 / FR1064) TaxID=1085623 RepID=G4QJ25_GLANF|nr:hypothetical protein GNIT_0749 [Glaciecola nitratireducens FR1064]
MVTKKGQNNTMTNFKKHNTFVQSVNVLSLAHGGSHSPT